MAIYAVYCPPGTTPTETPEALRFVPERPSFWAFVLPPIWLLAHRLWFGLLFWLVAVAALAWLYGLMPAAPATFVMLLFWLWFAFAARDIEQATLARAGWTLAGLVEAPNRDAAERRFFEAAADVPPPHGPVGLARPAAPIVGFEGFGGRR